MKVTKDYDLKRVISFHSKIKSAESFSNFHSALYEWVSKKNKPEGRMVSDFVSGTMSTGKRISKLRRLKEIEGDERGLLSNARCLSEGVDVPTLDGVAFIEPRKSHVDIVQAVGRAIRKSENKSFGTIFIPVFKQFLICLLGLAFLRSSNTGISSNPEPLMIIL